MLLHVKGLVSLLIFTKHVMPSQISDCNPDQMYYIRHRYSGLTADATDSSLSLVQIQNLNRNPEQRWTFECTETIGLFYITNVETGTVMDYVRNATQYGWYIQVKSKDDSLYQKWYINSDGIIYNAAKHQCVLNVVEGRFVPGHALSCSQENGSDAQDFILQQVID